MKLVTYRPERTGRLRPVVYRAEHKGKTYRFEEGRALSVPNELAKKLGDLPGDSFQIKDSKEEN